MSGSGNDQTKLLDVTTDMVRSHMYACALCSDFSDCSDCSNCDAFRCSCPRRRPERPTRLLRSKRSGSRSFSRKTFVLRSNRSSNHYSEYSRMAFSAPVQESRRAVQDLSGKGLLWGGHCIAFRSWHMQSKKRDYGGAALDIELWSNDNCEPSSILAGGSEA